MVLNYSNPGLLSRITRAVYNLLSPRPAYETGNIFYAGYIDGYQYHKGAQMEHLFKKGTEFSLKPEPENPFDDDAVAIYYDEDRIGFIPPDTNVEIARRIQKGEPLKARIARIEPQSDPWERVFVEVVNGSEE